MLNYPEKSIALQRLEILNKYHTLTSEQHLIYKRLKRGFAGEKAFATLLKNEVSSNYYVLYDLRLRVNESEVQIDCLLFIHNTAFLFEIKNYHGNYLHSNDRWYITSSEKEIKNPLYQLQRSELLLKEFFFQQQISQPIISKLIFIHPEFHLYQAPMLSSIIFPTQLKQFFKLQRMEQAQPMRNNFSKLAYTLQEHHQAISLYEQVPRIQLSQLRKGIYCKDCTNKMTSFTKKTFICHVCKTKEIKEKAILRCVLDYRTLFPNEKITKDSAFNWIGKTTSIRTVQRVLAKHFSKSGNGSQSFYF